jgi:glycogen synthase
MTKMLGTYQNGSSSYPGQKDKSLSLCPFALDEKGPFIFAASQVWDETKNVRLLEAVARRLPWPIYAAGENCSGSNSTPLRDVNSLGLLDFDELQSWFAWASIFVLPANDKSSFLLSLQAARAGCALVLSDVPSLRRVWGNAALYFSPNDLENLEVELVLLIMDSTFREMMANRAFARAQKFAPERRGSRSVSAYPDLAAGYQQRIS